MKISKKQKQEIDFLEKCYGAKNYTEKDIEDYLNATVHGKGKADKFEKNELMMAKRRLDIQIKLWREDMQDGILAYWELEEDEELKHPYFLKILKTMRKTNVTKPHYDGNFGVATVAYLNSKHHLK